MATLFVDFHCPNGRCNRFLVRVPVGTPIERGSCRGCGLIYKDQIAR